MANNRVINPATKGTNDSTAMEQVACYPIDSNGDDITETNPSPVSLFQSGSSDENNSTETPLVADAVFTGIAVDISNYSAITMLVHSDVASATNGLVVQFSQNGTDWHDGESYTIAAGANKFFTPPVQAKYYRVSYTNGGSDQSSFHLHTMLKKFPMKWSSHNISDPISAEDDAELTKSVITGLRDDDTFGNATLSNSNRLKTVSQPYTYAVAEGDIPNQTALLKFGTRTSVAAGVSSLLWEGTSPTYSYMTTAAQLVVVSSSASDSSAGTGIRTLTLVGLDSNFDELTETITMNGTTNVTTTNSFIRIFRAFGATCGTAYTNVGTITISSGGTIRAVIVAGDGQTLMSMWTVPRGQSLLITNGSFSTNSNKGARISLFTRQLDGGINYPWRIRYRAFTFSGNDNFPFTAPFKIPERTDIEVRVLTPGSAGTTSCGATFEGWYELN